MPFVENYCLQLAIMLNHRKPFSCSGMIHYQMKVTKSFSVQFINIYNKPNDFHQIIRLMDLNPEMVCYSNQQAFLLMFHDTDYDCYHYY